MLDIKNLTIINTKTGLEILSDVSIHVNKGDIYAIAGQSGSGKTMMALAIMGLLPENIKIASGQINFLGKDISSLSEKEMSSIRGRDISIVFQDPLSSLDPLMRIGKQIEEPLRCHYKRDRGVLRNLALEMMEAVGLPDPKSMYMRYPHQLSGGQRQRAMIASALICHPKLILADEPTTALDVIVQKKIISLLKEINRKYGTAIIFITHDLSVARALCSKVSVLYNGHLMESSSVKELFENPKTDYSKALIESISLRGV